MSLINWAVGDSLTAHRTVSSAAPPQQTTRIRPMMDEDAAEDPNPPYNNNHIVVKTKSDDRPPPADVHASEHGKRTEDSKHYDESSSTENNEKRSEQGEVTVHHETTLVSLVDGTMLASGKRVLLYRCGLCSLLYADLDCLYDHLRKHAFSPTRLQNESRALHVSVDERNAVSVSSDGEADLTPSKFNGNGGNPAVGTGIVCARVAQRQSSSGKAMNYDDDEEEETDRMHGDSSSSSSLSPQLHIRSTQQVAEDLSKNCAQRRIRSTFSNNSNSSIGSRRRSIQSLHCRRPTQRLSLVTSDMLAVDGKNVDVADATGHPAGGETFANALRHDEKLDEEVPVVIPSDVPLDVTTKRHQLQQVKPETPVASSWGGNGGGGDESGKRIAHSPVKSILGYPLIQKKSPRSVGGQPSAVADGSPPPPLQSMASGIDASTGYTPSQMSMMSAAAESLQFAGTLPAMFGPLALSTFVNGFGGLVAAASPFLSYYTQMPANASLASMMAVSGAGGLSCPSVVTPMATQLMVGNGDCSENKPVADSSSDSFKDKDLPPGPGGAVSADAEDVSNSSGSGTGWSPADPAAMTNFTGSNSKCSSLSRTHSRLNVVRRPIKREDACRPVVLSDGRTAFRCIYCKKDFCTISDVNRHMDFHEDIRPYKCRFCNYYARTNSQLKVHMMRHQGIREYMCRLCNYKGVTQSDLNRHTKSQIHLMKARNECVQCSEGFVSPMNLEQHRQDKHCLPRSQLTTGPGGHAGGPPS